MKTETHIDIEEKKQIWITWHTDEQDQNIAAID